MYNVVINKLKGDSTLENIIIYMGLGNVALYTDSVMPVFELYTFNNKNINKRVGDKLERDTLPELKKYIHISDYPSLKQLKDIVNTVSESNKRIKYQNIILDFEYDKIGRSLRILKKYIDNAMNAYITLIAC